MATNTYVALDTKTLASTTTSVVFTSIPQTYTDLIIVFSGTVATLDNNNITFNGDTGSNYSTGRITGTNSAGTTSRGSNLNAIQCGEIGTSQSSDIIQIQNYSNTTTNKMVMHRSGNTTQFLKFSLGMWRNTAAITSITITNGGVFTVGSTFTMYGIASSNIGAPKAFGGTITQDANYTYHTFGASGTFTPQQSLTADVLVVAGGGGGRGSGGGAGGAGGLLTHLSQSLTATGYTVTVGSGGSGGQSSGATSGGNSQFGALTTVIGGGVGGYRTTSNGATGGSGGGGGSWDSGAGSAGSGTSGQGYAGGIGFSTRYAEGGGGGAGGVGANATSTQSGNGGIGATSTLINSLGLATGTGQNVSGSIYYAGGGGGGGSNVTTVVYGIGGSGGGGDGATANGVVGISGQSNTGGGGGGGWAGSTDTNGGNGGSGIVIIRYAN